MHNIVFYNSIEMILLELEGIIVVFVHSWYQCESSRRGNRRYGIVPHVYSYRYLTQIYTPCVLNEVAFSTYVPLITVIIIIHFNLIPIY